MEAVPDEPDDDVAPDADRGLASAVEVLGPVSPVLVALAWLVLAPEAPDAATGVASTVTPPPDPASASVRRGGRRP